MKGQWKNWFDLSRISGVEHKGKVRDYPAYLLRSGECLHAISCGEMMTDRAELIEKERESWDAILAKENRVKKDEEKGRDSRLASRIILPVPNTCSGEEVMKKLSDYFQSFGVHNLIVLHQGKKGKRGIENKHIHVQFSERDSRGGKKNREIGRKDFVPGFKTLVTRELERQGFEIVTNLPEKKRTRISRAAFYANQRGEQILNPSAKLDIEANLKIKNQKQQQPQRGEERRKEIVNKKPQMQPQAPASIPARSFKLRPMPGSQPLQKRDRDDFTNLNPEPSAFRLRRSGGPGR